jgi:hypothetical protein
MSHPFQAHLEPAFLKLIVERLPQHQGGTSIVLALQSGANSPSQKHKATPPKKREKMAA